MLRSARALCSIGGKNGKAVEILPRVLARTSSKENVQAIWSYHILNLL